MSKKNSRDISDSERDEKRLQPEETIIDLPDVKDIPGQENIHVPKLREMADTTISSADEEGVGIWDYDESLEPADINPGKLESKSDKEYIDGDDKKADDTDLEITDDPVDPESDVSPDEKKILERSADNMDTPDNEDLFRSELDNTDFDGEKLNEDIELTGKDLDVPGSEDDDANEEIGEEDEENNSYSEADTE